MSYGDSVPKVTSGWAGWWEKSKQYVYYLVWALVGLFGGNVDRVDEFFPESLTGTSCPCKVECPCDELDADVPVGDADVPVDNDSEAKPDRDYSK